MNKFVLKAPYQPTGDQPQVIAELVKGFKEGNQCQTLLGVTGSGKTFTMANVMLSWPKKNSGSIQLHGHIHAREEYNFQNKVDGITRYDVGVDANCYYPVSVKQIIKFFENNEGKCKL